MHVDVRTEIVIARPRGVVSSFAGDPGNAPRWYVNIRSVEWLTPPPLMVGSEIAFVARFMGRTLRYTYAITELAPGARLVMRTVDGPFPMETTYEWSDAGDGTRMRLINRGTPSGFSSLLAPFLRMAMRRANRKDLGRLKAVLESA
jgi:hypothetical protein